MLIARYDKSKTPWKRRKGIYGHWPKYTMHWWWHPDDYPEDHSGLFCRDDDCVHCASVERRRFWRPRQTMCGYLALVLPRNHYVTFFYQGNPGYRGRKWQVIEVDGTPYPFPSKRLR